LQVVGLVTFLEEVDLAAEVPDHVALRGLERKRISQRKTSHSEYERKMRSHGTRGRLRVIGEQVDASCWAWPRRKYVTQGSLAVVHGRFSPVRHAVHASSLRIIL
jgi:hypothetical protein